MKALDTIRFIAALAIFFHHWQRGGVSVCEVGGDMGVAFFFMTSGYVLCEGYASRLSNGMVSPREFLLRRANRLLPLHFICWTLFILGATIGLWRFHGIGPLLSNLLLLQSWIPHPHYYFSANAVGWCLANFMFLYAIFPWLVKLGKHIVWPTLAGAGAILIAGQLLTSPEQQHSFLYIWPPARTVDFMIGMTLWQLTRTHQRYGTAAEAAAVVLLSTAIFLWSQVNSAYALGALWWIPMSMLLYAFGRTGQQCGIVGRMLSFGGSRFMGQISFPLYMIHYLAIKVWHSFELPDHLIYALLILAISILLAIPLRNLKIKSFFTSLFPASA